MTSQEPNMNDTSGTHKRTREDEEEVVLKQPNAEKTFVDVKRKYADCDYERIYFSDVTEIFHYAIIDAIKENYEKFHFPAIDKKWPGFDELLIFDATRHERILPGYKVESGSKIEVTRACEQQRGRFLRKVNREYAEDEKRMLAEVRYQMNKRKGPFLASLTDEEKNMLNYPEV